MDSRAFRARLRPRTMIASLESFRTLLEENVRAIFSKDGLLARAKNFEYRPQQQEMAVPVAKALAERSHLLVEAGTAVGKSLPYPIPPALHALQGSRHAVS